MRSFLRKPAIKRAPLPITMSGVRMGERLLQIGVNDSRLAGVLVAKVGLSGHAAIAVADERAASRARDAAAEAGALADIRVTPLHTLPFDTSGFDVIVINSADGLLAAVDADTRSRLLSECHRVLRQGGRVVAIEAELRSGLAALLRARRPDDSAYVAAGGTPGAMEAAGFKPVRLLAEREGYRFTEGLKSL